MIDFLLGTGLEVVQYLQKNPRNSVDDRNLRAIACDFKAITEELQLPPTSCGVIVDRERFYQLVKEIDPLMTKLSPPVQRKWSSIQSRVQNLMCS